MKNFLKPTKITWIIFLPLALVTLFPLVLLAFIVIFWSLDPGGPPRGDILDILKAAYPFIMYVAGEYLLASLMSFLFNKGKNKQSNKL